MSFILNTIASGGGGGSQPVKTTYVATTPYQVLPTDDVILVDTATIASASTIYLIEAPTVDGQVWTIKDESGAAATYNITVQSTNGDVNIDDATTFVLATNYESASFVWSSAQGQYYYVDSANASSGGISTIDGDSGSVTGSTITITGGTSGAVFTGSGSTLTESFNYLSLPNSTSSSSGVIKIDGNVLFQAPQVSSHSNLFIGLNSASSAGYTAGASYTDNTGVGSNSLFGLQNGYGSYNTAFGSGALFSMQRGSYNTAIGYNTLSPLYATCNYNTALGYNAGSHYDNAESNNIVINNVGNSGETNTLRIGAGTGTGNQELQAAYIAGINGVDLSSTEVVTMSGDQLGSATLTEGSGITITTGSNEIIISASGGSGISTIDGDSGSVTGSTITISGGTSGGSFSGSSTTLTMSFSNLSFTNSGVLIGLDAGVSLTSPYSNVAIGRNSLTNATGVTNDEYNVAVGYNSLGNQNGGLANSVIGNNAGAGISTAQYNCGLGYNCLLGNGFSGTLSGTYNLAIGAYSGANYTSSESSNILLNNQGTVSESNVCRIGAGTGSSNQQLNATYIAGIQGIGVTGSAVLVSSGDQLGVAVSSARYKDNIEDMGDVSSSILDLRPVTFTYKEDKSQTQAVGLIAEEVNDIMPNLVCYDKEGLPQTVKYHDLPVLVLNELQKALKRIEVLEQKLNQD